MKLVIQIPCRNEAATLPATLRDLPRKVRGFDEVEWLVVDDGSTDGTADTALACGVDHLLRLPGPLGLARAFAAGIDAALHLGADVIVNTDGDNQYVGADLHRLVEPILAGRADLAIGARAIPDIPDFSPLKKILQQVGSWVVRRLSGTDVQDAPCGFRAFGRFAAERLLITDTYTYTLESIIQAGHERLRIASVPIRTNRELRPSRLIRSVPQYLFRSAQTLARCVMMYYPFRFFAYPAAACALLGLAGGTFLWNYGGNPSTVRDELLMLAVGLLLSTAVGLFLLAWFAELTAVNRKLLQQLDRRIRGREPGLPELPSKPREEWSIPFDPPTPVTLPLRRVRPY